ARGPADGAGDAHGLDLTRRRARLERDDTEPAVVLHRPLVPEQDGDEVSSPLSERDAGSSRVELLRPVAVAIPEGSTLRVATLLHGSGPVAVGERLRRRGPGRIGIPLP